MGVVFDLKMPCFLQSGLYPQTFLEGRIRAFCGVSWQGYPGKGARTGPGFPGEKGRRDGIVEDLVMRNNGGYVMKGRIGTDTIFRVRVIGCGENFPVGFDRIFLEKFLEKFLECFQCPELSRICPPEDPRYEHCRIQPEYLMQDEILIRILKAHTAIPKPVGASK